MFTLTIRILSLCFTAQFKVELCYLTYIYIQKMFVWLHLKIKIKRCYRFQSQQQTRKSKVFTDVPKMESRTEAEIFQKKPPLNLSFSCKRQYQSHNPSLNRCAYLYVRTIELLFYHSQHI